MTMKTQPWFPHPIYMDQLEGPELEDIQAELTHMYEQQRDRMSKHPDWERDTHSLTDPNFNSNVLVEYPCPAFINWISRSLQDYLMTVGVEPQWAQDYRISNSWCTLTRKHEFARMHDHGATDIAGVYYLKTTGKDGNFYFKTPNEQLAHSYAFQKIPNAQEIEPREGQLIMWPGFLFHGTKVNNTDDERISISFNIIIKRWWQDQLFPQDILDVVKRTDGSVPPPQQG